MKDGRKVVGTGRKMKKGRKTRGKPLKEARKTKKGSSKLGVMPASFDFCLPSQTAFLSSENPYFRLGTWGAMYISFPLYVSLLKLVKSHENPCDSQNTRVSLIWFSPKVILHG